MFSDASAIAHACNPSYSVGRDQEDRGLKLPWVNSLQDPISKNSSQQRAAGVAQVAGPKFKPEYYQKEEKFCNCVQFS
jgi:hypothetical protein